MQHDDHNPYLDDIHGDDYRWSAYPPVRETPSPTLITIPEQHADALFDGTDTTGIDVGRSTAAYERLWIERIQACYPDAQVRVSQYMRAIEGDGILAPWDTVLHIQQLGEELCDDGAQWIVEAE